MKTYGKYRFWKQRMIFIQILGAVAAFCVMLFILATCQMSTIDEKPEPQPTSATIEAGISLNGPTDGVSITRHLYPIDVVTSSKELTVPTIIALSAEYTLSVQLEFALVKVPSVLKWDLFYISESLPITKVSWQEYMLFDDQPDANNTTDRSMRTLWWTLYAIQNSKQLTLSTGSTSPSTLAGWIEAITNNSGREPTSITRLLFSVKEDSKTKYILYLSDMQPSGQNSPIVEIHVAGAGRAAFTAPLFDGGIAKHSGCVEHFNKVEGEPTI